MQIAMVNGLIGAALAALRRYFDQKRMLWISLWAVPFGSGLGPESYFQACRIIQSKKV